MTFGRVVMVVAVACLAVGVVLRQGVGGSGQAMSGVHAGAYHQEGSEGLLSLSAAAQGPVSAALGGHSQAYRVSVTASGLRAVSPAERLAERFTRSGVAVASGDGRLGLALRAVGHGTRLAPVGRSLPHASANRVSYTHGAGVREWYANGPLGLEQGFKIARPPGAGSGPLTLSLALTGNLRARLRQGGVSLTGHGVALRYGGLVVRDARGRTLRAWFELHRGSVLIRVADRGARYPLRIDPLVQQAELTAADGAASDQFGESVAVSGGTIAVGASGRQVGSNAGQGAVYVFSNAGGGWAQTAELTASDGAVGDRFGQSVAVSGSTIAVGAPLHKVGSNQNQGAAYVFSNAGGGWAQTLELTAPDGAAGDAFGRSVAVSGGTIAVAAPTHMVGSNQYQGAVYVFSNAGGGWAQSAELTASDGAASDTFGASVAVSGSTIAVGAPEHQVGANAAQGTAYVFSNAGGSWAQSAELTGADGADGDIFGASVAVSGSTIAVGARRHQVGANAAQGAAYVFSNAGGSWAQTAEPTASDGAAVDLFGDSVAVSGSTIAIGAPYHQVGANAAQGAAYVLATPQLSVSVSTLNANGEAFGIANEGVGNPLIARVTITNPPDGVTATNITPALPGVSPAGALSATGAPSAPVPASGLQSLAPGSSVSFTVPYQIAAPGQAALSDSVTWQQAGGSGGVDGPATGMTTADLGSAVTGTVRNLDCQETCTATGLSNATILAVGKASDGTAISRTATSKSDGTYSIGVPAGGYTVGPTQDGKTIDGTGFDPLDRSAVVPAAAPLAGQDFSACALDSELGTAADRQSSADSAQGTPDALAAGLTPTPALGQLTAHVSTAAPAPTSCKSIYTIEVSAKIPQAHLVDPSSKAPYEESDHGGFNPSTNKPDATTPEFPACLSNAKVQKYTKAGETADWYTYIKGGKLGSVSASFAWDRKAQEVHLVGGPTRTVQRLTRVFVWRLHDHGKTIREKPCEEKNHVELLTLPVGGSDQPGGGPLTAREFSLITIWGFPFEPSGARVDPDLLVVRGTSILKKLYSYVHDFDKAVESAFGEIPGYKHLPSLARFGIEFAASYLVGTKIVNTIKAAPAAFESFEAAAKYLPQVLPALKAAGEAGEGIHVAKSSQEIIAYLAGLAAQGEYPIMGAVIRGRFLTAGYSHFGDPAKPSYVPLDSELALSVKTTKFPTISLKVSRDAERNVDPNNPVTTGLLPWATTFTPQLDVFNKLSSNPPYALTDAATAHYADGLHGVHEVHADTSQTPELTKAVEEHAEEGTNFDAEATEADLPACGSPPPPGSSICFTFKDGRP